MVGTNKRYTCQQHKWNGNLTCKQIFCPNDHDTAPKVQLVNPQSNYPVDYKLTFRCDPAYTLEGDSEVTCLQNGEWSSSNQTKCGGCSSYPRVDNAVVVSHYPGNRTGDTVKFECNLFYQMKGFESMTCTSQGTWNPAYPPVCALSIGMIILLVVLVLLFVVLIIVLLIWFIQYRMITNVISCLLSDTEMIEGVLLLKDDVQEAIDTLEDTWSPIKDCFCKFVWEKITCCKLTNELAEKMKILWKISWKNLKSQVKEDLDKVERYNKSTAKHMFQYGKDFKENVDELLKSANVAATISLYKPHSFSKIFQTKPDNYVNEQTKANRRILGVEAWSDAQKERGDEIYVTHVKLDKMKLELKLLERNICNLESLASQKERLEQEIMETNIQIATKTDALHTLMRKFQSDTTWELFTLLRESLETIMDFWSDEPDVGEAAENTKFEETPI